MGEISIGLLKHASNIIKFFHFRRENTNSKLRINSLFSILNHIFDGFCELSTKLSRKICDSEVILLI